MTRFFKNGTWASPLGRLPNFAVFAFANAGVNFTGIGIDDLLQPLTLGIAVGLFLGNKSGSFWRHGSASKVGLRGCLKTSHGDMFMVWPA